MTGFIYFQAITEMVEAYGGQWPPRPSFQNWPSAWNAYVTIADDMPRKCHELNDAGKFRKWMEHQVDELVGI